MTESQTIARQLRYA